MKVVFNENARGINLAAVFGLHDEEYISLVAEEYQALIVEGWGYKEIKNDETIMYALMKVVNTPDGKRLVPAFGQGKPLHMMKKFRGTVEIDDSDVEYIDNHIVINIIMNLVNLSLTYKRIKNVQDFKSKMGWHRDDFINFSDTEYNIGKLFAYSFMINDEVNNNNIKASENSIYEKIIYYLKKIQNKIDFENNSFEDINLIMRDINKILSLTESNKDVISRFANQINNVKKEDLNNTFGEESEDDTDENETDDFIKENGFINKMKDICNFFQSVRDSGGSIDSKILAAVRYMSENCKFDEWKSAFLKLPFARPKSKPPSSLQDFKDKLEKSHYGMEEVKRLFTEEAAYNMNGKSTDHVLCLNGSPGVGKTSIAKAFAEAMGREFFTISLGGDSDAFSISGFQITWNGATPGRIMKAIMMSKTKNPVILLDEIDKSGESSRGSVSSALLDVLDPKQRAAYTDRYFGFPYDLSDVTFITTSNYLDKIPYELRDRLRVVDIPSYSDQEKLMIAQNYILPDLSKKSGLSLEKIGLTENLIKEIIRDYTFEAGCRNLEKKLDSIVRNAVVQEAMNETMEVNSQNMKKLMGNPIPRPNISAHIGRINGLSVSIMGGTVMTIEAALRRDSFTEETMSFVSDEQKTGNMRQVMLESISVAKTALISNMSGLGMNDEKRILNAHVHAASAATPKDGPSAGLAISLAIMSAVTKQLPREGVAMTGEISLSGDVLPIGGVRDKIFGAMKAGINTVIIPHGNLNEAMQVPEKDREGLIIIPVSHLWDAVRVVFERPAQADDYAGNVPDNEIAI